MPHLLDTVRSWTATARFAAAERRTGATTAAYTSDVLDATHKGLAEVRQQLETHPMSADTAREARAAIDSLLAAARALDEASRAR